LFTVSAEDERQEECPDLPIALMSPDGTRGWYACRPDGSRPVIDEDQDPIVEVIRLRPDPDAGPFWEPDQLLSDDFDELRRWVGISRETYDAAMAWNDRWVERRQQRADPATCEQERQGLIARMRAEAHEGISFE
jgi:hypothetical protein